MNSQEGIQGCSSSSNSGSRGGGSLLQGELDEEKEHKVRQQGAR